MSMLASVQEEPEEAFTPDPVAQPALAPPPRHDRQHWRVHSRNLSVFFPRPDQQIPGDPFSAASRSLQSPPSPVDIRSPARQSNPLTRNDDRTEGYSRPAQRRGHHHRHSVSMQIPSPSALRPSGASGELASSKNGIDSERPIANGHVTPARLEVPRQSRSGLASLAIASAQIAIGAYLWIRGQGLESLSTTGLGYLVVFDGAAVLLDAHVAGRIRRHAFPSSSTSLMAKQDPREQIRLPYGLYRLATLSHFAQSIYLLFSAIYISKESIEHVLLLSGSGEQTGGHVHGHSTAAAAAAGAAETAGMAAVQAGGTTPFPVPLFALSLSAVLACFLAVAARNHETLASCARLDQLGRSGGGRRGATRALTGPGNPFTLALLGTTLTILAAACILPPALFAAFDKFFALLEAAIIFHIARPAALASAQILAQAMPRLGSDTAQPHAWLHADSLHMSAVQEARLSHIWLRNEVSSTESAIVAVADVTLAGHASDAQMLQVAESARAHLLQRPPASVQLDLVVDGMDMTALCGQHIAATLYAGTPPTA